MRHVALPLLLVLCLLPPCPVTAETTQQVFAHMFAVPSRLPDGSDAAPRIRALEDWLATTYGGYTRLGPGAGGWKNEQGQVENEANTTYIVTAPRDAGKSIADRLRQEFGVRVPYVLVFSADRFVP